MKETERKTMTIANPLYDVVFKYLLEDIRIARTILSAFLRQDVVSVSVRPHEYSNASRENLSVFRIDFGATIRDASGGERLVLIELQKTWLETETLRFRQYLATQYSSKQNIKADSKEGYALPMIAVYLLGHKVDGLMRPVTYIKNQHLDHEDMPTGDAVPNEFVESVAHECVIVQIPKLKELLEKSNRAKNTKAPRGRDKLNTVLSFFDQSRQSAKDKQTIDVDPEAYSADPEMKRILERLIQAAADPQVRREMDVEDEYFSVIEKRDTTIMLKNKELEQKNAQIEEQTAQIEQQTAQIEQQTAQIEEQTAQLQKSVKILLQAGMSPSDIAASTGIRLNEIQELL